MKAIIITNAIQQKRIDALIDALNHLSKVYALIGQEQPRQAEENAEYKDSMLEAELSCTNCIVSLSDAIGCLTSSNLIDHHLTTNLFTGS